MKRLIVVAIFCLGLTGCSTIHAKSAPVNPEEQTIYIAPGRKLEDADWRNDELWILTRPMREGEIAEEYTFEQHSNGGILDSRINVIESTSED